MGAPRTIKPEGGTGAGTLWQAAKAAGWAPLRDEDKANGALGAEPGAPWCLQAARTGLGPPGRWRS
jgi:hypothetical protein